MYTDPTLGGHYNIQHFESAGLEYALEAWFNGDGTGNIRTGGVDYSFIYPQGSWFPVEHFIDLDSDWIRVIINGIVVHEWPFSYTSNSTTGTNQLGGVDFYAGTKDGSDPIYLIDDLLFQKIMPSQIPLSGWSIFLALGLILLFTIFILRRRA
jgi:hypothetical protein